MPLKPIGGLWPALTRHGEDYLSGSIQIGGKKVKIIVFENHKRRDERDPKYSVWKQTEAKPKPRKQSGDRMLIRLEPILLVEGIVERKESLINVKAEKIVSIKGEMEAEGFARHPGV
jgi:hypothetical protein